MCQEVIAVVFSPIFLLLNWIKNNENEGSKILENENTTSNRGFYDGLEDMIEVKVDLDLNHKKKDHLIFYDKTEDEIKSAGPQYKIFEQASLQTLTNENDESTDSSNEDDENINKQLKYCKKYKEKDNIKYYFDNEGYDDLFEKCVDVAKPCDGEDAEISSGFTETNSASTDGSETNITGLIQDENYTFIKCLSRKRDSSTSEELNIPHRGSSTVKGSDGERLVNTSVNFCNAECLHKENPDLDHETFLSGTGRDSLFSYMGDSEGGDETEEDYETFSLYDEEIRKELETKYTMTSVSEGYQSETSEESNPSQPPQGDEPDIKEESNDIAGIFDYGQPIKEDGSMFENDIEYNSVKHNKRYVISLENKKDEATNDNKDHFTLMLKTLEKMNDNVNCDPLESNKTECFDKWKILQKKMEKRSVERQLTWNSLEMKGAMRSLSWAVYVDKQERDTENFALMKVS